jgi:exodeoxyribonuclease VII small subunit
MNANEALSGVPFETLLAQLRDTVARLDGHELTLDEAVLAYEECVRIANACAALLDNAELRVTQINVSATALRELPESYAYSSSGASSQTARRLLLGDDEDELEDFLDDEP